MGIYGTKNRITKLLIICMALILVFQLSPFAFALENGEEAANTSEENDSNQENESVGTIIIGGSRTDTNKDNPDNQDTDEKQPEDTELREDETEDKEPLEPECEHQWGPFVEIKEATADEDGELRAECLLCHAVKTEVIEKHVHVYNPTSGAETMLLGETAPGDVRETAENHVCAICGHVQTESVKAAVNLSVKLDVTGQSVYVDGILTASDAEGNVTLPDENSRVITTMSYLSNSDGYEYPNPAALRVYFISRDSEGAICAERVTALDGLLQYAGSSIKTAGEQGIRTITEIPSAARNQLISGLNGWVLEEYGTVVAWDSEINAADPTLDMGVSKSAYAYKSGVRDSIFATNGSNIQYTNVLTFDSYEKCKPVLAMRPYLILSNGTESMTIYGGTVHRSIAYIAYQNKDVYARGTSEYNFIRAIINACGVPDGLEPIQDTVCNYLCIGNSIAYREPDGQYWWGSWGMAASTAANDYYHRVKSYISSNYDIANSTLFYYGVGTTATWETSSNRSACLYELDGVLNESLTLVSIQLGENVTDKSTFAADLAQLVSYIQARAPKAQIIIVGDVWDFAGCDSLKQSVAASMNVAFADLSAIKSNVNYRAGFSTVYGDDGRARTINNVGVATHLGDSGMAYVANAITALIR